VARGGRAPAGGGAWRRGLAAAARSAQQPSKQRTSAERWQPAARSRARGQAALEARVRRWAPPWALGGQARIFLFFLNDSEKKKGEQADDEQCAILISNYLLICDNCRAM